jgi:hypothetical protein
MSRLMAQVGTHNACVLFPAAITDSQSDLAEVTAMCFLLARQGGIRGGEACLFPRNESLRIWGSSWSP